MKVRQTFALLLMLASVLVIVWNALFGRRAKARRALERSQPIPIERVRPGMMVKLIGRVELRSPSRPLIGPLSQKPCAHYELLIKEKRQKGWRTLVHEKDTQDFWLVDDSGRVLIEATVAQVLLTMDERRRSGIGKDAPPRLEALLRRHGQKSTGWVFNKNLRYREGLLEPGETVAVVGRCRDEADPAGSADARRLVIGEPPEGDLVVTDDVNFTS